MYQPAIFAAPRSYEDEDTNSYVDTYEKAELNASVYYTERFFKSRISIYKSRSWLAEKQQKHEEKRQLQRVTSFSQRNIRF